MEFRSDIKMFINYGRSAHRSCYFPMATYSQDINIEKQKLYSSSTKKKAEIRKAGITGIIVILVLMLLIVGRIL